MSTATSAFINLQDPDSNDVLLSFRKLEIFYFLKRKLLMLQVGANLRRFLDQRPFTSKTFTLVE